METTLTIIVLIFGVLQIILFFKLWGMTNQIEQLRDHFVKPESFLDKAEQAYLYGNKEATEKFLRKYSLISIYDCARCNNDNNHETSFNKKIKELEKHYKFFDIEMPDYNKYKNRETALKNIK